MATLAVLAYLLKQVNNPLIPDTHPWTSFRGDRRDSLKETARVVQLLLGALATDKTRRQCENSAARSLHQSEANLLIGRHRLTTGRPYQYQGGAG